MGCKCTRGIDVAKGRGGEKRIVRVIRETANPSSAIVSITLKDQEKWGYKEMIDMLMEQASTVRREWSAVCDSAIHGKPKFIMRTHDKMWLSNLEIMLDILEAYQFTAVRYIEGDGSVTLSLNEIDIIENGKDDKDVRLKIGKAILEYSTEYYNEYEMYSHSPNRKKHIPYIFKALIISCPEKIGDILQCQDGEN